MGPEEAGGGVGFGGGGGGAAAGGAAEVHGAGKCRPSTGGGRGAGRGLTGRSMPQMNSLPHVWGRGKVTDFQASHLKEQFERGPAVQDLKAGSMKKGDLYLRGGALNRARHKHKGASEHLDYQQTLSMVKKAAGGHAEKKQDFLFEKDRKVRDDDTLETRRQKIPHERELGESSAAAPGWGARRGLTDRPTTQTRQT